jgi:uncharacterized protein
MKVIDFRARPSTSEYLGLFTGPGAEREWEINFRYSRPAEVSLDQFVKDVEEAGVDKAVFTGRQSANRSISNDYVAECMQRFPDRIIGTAGANVEAGPAAVAEVERAITKLGLRALSLDAHYVKSNFNDPRFYPLYEKALELDVPVIMTVGPLVGQAGAPIPIDAVAERYPDLKIVCSHAAWPQAADFLALAYRHENVYIEPSIYWMLPGGDLFVEFANEWMPDKIIYASAFPFRPMTDAELFAKLPLREGVREKVMWENAARLLKLI